MKSVKINMHMAPYNLNLLIHERVKESPYFVDLK